MSLWTYGLNFGSFEVTPMGLGSCSWHPFSGLLANNTNGLVDGAGSSRQGVQRYKVRQANPGEVAEVNDITKVSE